MRRLLRTGDVASRDGDGYITFVGRADDVFKASDYRISPFELENAMIEHEAVAEVAIVPSPDPLRLAVPKAYLILVAGPELAEAIFVFARERLAPYKRVRRIEFVAELPKTISGKIRRVSYGRRKSSATRAASAGRWSTSRKISLPFEAPSARRRRKTRSSTQSAGCQTRRNARLRHLHPSAAQKAASIMPLMPSSRPRPTTRRLPRDERISKIMSVTRAMLAEKGYDNIVTAEVAERCSVSEATIYKYFASKRDLLIRVAEQWFDELLREDHRSVAGRGALEALRQLVWRSLTVVRREPALTRFVLLDLRPDPAYRAMPVFELNRRFTAQVAEVLREGVANRELRDDVPVSLLRDMIFGCIEHQTWAYLRGEGDFSVEEVTDGIVTVVYRGMRSAPTGSEAATKNGLDDALQRLERVTARLEQAAPQAASARRGGQSRPRSGPPSA